MHAFGLVQRDDALCADHGCLGIEREARIDFGRNPARNDGQDLGAKARQQAVHDFIGGLATELLDCFRQQRRIFRLLHRFQDQRRIGGGILRLELRQLVEIAGICHHRGQRFQCIELVHGRLLKKRAFSAHPYWISMIFITKLQSRRALSAMVFALLPLFSRGMHASLTWFVRQRRRAGPSLTQLAPRSAAPGPDRARRQKSPRAPCRMCIRSRFPDRHA
ncbi:hypothetical protein D3C72_1240240 [compost metagenome]